MDPQNETFVANTMCHIPCVNIKPQPLQYFLHYELCSVRCIIIFTKQHDWYICPYIALLQCSQTHENSPYNIYCYTGIYDQKEVVVMLKYVHTRFVVDWCVQRSCYISSVREKAAGVQLLKKQNSSYTDITLAFRQADRVD